MGAHFRQLASSAVAVGHYSGAPRLLITTPLPDQARELGTTHVSVEPGAAEQALVGAS
jgi:hypothetical protein